MNIQNEDRSINLKVKKGTSYSVFDLIEKEQTQQLDLPFEINGSFEFIEKKCSCCEDRSILIIGVYEDHTFAVVVDKDDVEFEDWSKRNLPTSIDELTYYFQEQIKKINSYV